MPTPYKSTTQQTERRTSATLPEPLSPYWAFVVQLRTGTPLRSEHVSGRIEHLASGQATTFNSLEGIRSFMEQVLSQKEGKPP